MSILLTILGTVAGSSIYSAFANATSSQAVNNILTQVGSAASQEAIKRGAKKLSGKK